MKKLLYSTLFIVIGLALYAQSLQYGFFMDDSFQIVTNRLVHDLSSWYLNFTKSTVDYGAGNTGGIYYKPLMMIAYSFLWQITPEQTISFRIFQLLLHCLNATMIFFVFKSIFKSEKIFLSLLAGLIFLLHPINSEAVLFIADLQEPLYTFFGLLGLLTLMTYDSKISTYLASLLLLCSLFSKESGLLFILVSIVYYFLFNKKNKVQLVTSISLTILIYLIFRFSLAELNNLHSDTMRISRLDLIGRLITVPKVLIHYIHLFFWPKDISLTQDWIVQSLDFQSFWLPLTEVIALVSVSLIYIYKQKDKIFLFWFLWFGFGWGLHSQLIPLDGTVSDRWFYFTMIGFMGLLIHIITNKLKPHLQILFLFPLLVPLAYRTHLRILNWSNPLTLYSHDLQVDPNSFYLNNNVGLEYFGKTKFNEALPFFEKTILNTVEKSREWYAAYANLGATYLYLYQPEKAESILKIAIQSGDVKAYRSYAAALLDLGKKKEFFAFIEKAFIQFPNDASLLKLKAMVKE